MSRAYPPKHAHTHRSGGSDPIPGLDEAIKYDTDNEGGWLEVITNNAAPLSGLGTDIRDTSSGGMRFTNESDSGNVLLGYPVDHDTSSQDGELVLGLSATGDVLRVRENNGTTHDLLLLTSSTLVLDGQQISAAASLELSGLTGAIQASRYVGATTSGAPVSGTFAVGDFVIARDGHVWICTVAGSPGTFVDAGTASGITDITSVDNSVIITGPTGPTADLSVADSPAVGGITVTGTPSVGDVLTATSSTTADWEPPSPGTGIEFDTLNAGDWLDVESTSTDGSGWGQHYLDSGGGGILLESNGPVELLAGGANLTIVAGSVEALLAAGGSWFVQDHSGGNLLVIDEASGEITPTLPTSPGTSGSLWNDSGIVKVA